ncbi:MAG: transketolase, partial [Magnetospiraceae bacterium]
MANAIRFLSVDAVQKANSGHPGMPMGMADVATVLYRKFMKFDPDAPDWADRDRFVLSAGHGSMLLYSLLYLTGYPEMTAQELSNFRQLGAKTAGHPEYGHAKGIETTTGPLGQGITTAVGMAFAEKLLNARYGDLVDHRTYVIAGDGCLMEGISQEAISFAGHHKLGKLIVFWDDNEICIDGKTSMAVSDDQLARFAASGWQVTSVDGHDAAAIEAAITAAQAATDQPSLIGCKTTIGYGAPSLGGSHKTHGAPLGAEEIAATRAALNWPHDPFVVPEDVLAAWREVAGRGKAARAAWEEKLNGADNGAAFQAAVSGDLPKGWIDSLNAHKQKMAEEAPKKATRASSGMALEPLTEAIPQLISGSADLTGSNNTVTSHTPSITVENPLGRYVHYGVREHGMAAIMNGIALHGGFIPFSGTFLVFADYMRGAMRLSALMEQRVIYVLTHDSIGLGEDGPTHQPVETLANLRALPNFNVYRPADAVEVAECWMLAVQSANTPSGMVLSRQGVPTLRTTHVAENLSAKGAYVLQEADGPRKVTLLATGSEVQIAVAAREALQGEGIPTAVVSMPCWELFEAQDATYRAEVLGPGTVRVAVEAAVRQGWDRYLGETGAFVGMAGFGASAPAGDLYKHFGITAEAVSAA